ncbi:MAG: MMPL family transporter, partial [Methanolinea sp.]|nr:MMPL family transporter [Methanolinea sp.]
VARHPVPILLLCALVAFIGFQMDNEIIINTNEDTFVPPDMPAMVDLKKVSRTMGSTSSLPIYVRGDNVLDSGTITWMYEFQKYEESHNEKITGSRSIADLLIQYNGGVLPQTNSELNAALEKIPRETADLYVNGKSEAIITFSTVDMENEVALSMIESVRSDLKWNEPPAGVSATVTGMGEMFSNLINEIAKGKTQMTVIAFVLIFVFLFLIYRRFGKTATPVIPIMMIVGWNGLIMYLLGIDYTPLTATLGSMTIGVASEYTILIMERAYEERAAGMALVPAIAHGVRQIGTAITVSGLTTVFGFAALIASSFNIISNFGVVTVITVGFSLIGAIVVMPAVLVLFGRLEDARENVPAGNDQQVP